MPKRKEAPQSEPATNEFEKAVEKKGTGKKITKVDPLQKKFNKLVKMAGLTDRIDEVEVKVVETEGFGKIKAIFGLFKGDRDDLKELLYEHATQYDKELEYCALEIVAEEERPMSFYYEQKPE